MRVLHVAPSLAPRLGGPSNLLGLAGALVRQGCDVSVYATDLDEKGRFLPWPPPRRLDVPTNREIADGGVNLRYFPVHWPTRAACSWRMAAALGRNVGTFDLVQIHSLFQFPGLAAAYFCRRAGVPYVLRPQGAFDPFDQHHHRGRKVVYYRLFEHRNVVRAAAIHYTSQTEAEHARQVGVTAPGFVVPLGIDPQSYADLPPHGRFRANHPPLENRRLVVFLGRITPKKGFDLLIPALARVAARVPEAHLVLAGPDNEGYASTVKDLIAAQGLGSRVTWTGLVTGARKLELLRDADVWVLPSYDENFAVAAVEAMAAAAPVVVSERVAVQDAVRRADAGLVVPTSVDALADAIEAILTNQRLRTQMGSNGQRLVASEFTWDVTANRLMRVYREILHPPPVRTGGADCITQS